MNKLDGRAYVGGGGKPYMQSFFYGQGFFVDQDFLV